jgi:hypothetical protein
MSDGITLDWKQFDASIVQYEQYSHRDFADITNNKLGDVAFRGAQLSEKASKDLIRNIWHSKSWWPKFIQKVIHMQGGFKIHYRRRVRKSAVNRMKGLFPDIDSTREETAAAYGQRSYGGDRKATGSYADAVRVSKKIIKRRVNTVGMFKAVFSIVAMRFGKRADRLERAGRNYFTIVKATPGNLSAGFAVPFKNTKSAWPGGTRPSASKDVATKVRLGYKFLQRGINFVVADMDQYAQRKMEETARRVSAK